MVSELKPLVKEWLNDCQIRQHTAQTIETRRVVTGKLIWFLEENGFATCGTAQLRQFLAYLTNGHKQACGRWNKAFLNKPVRPVTVQMYFNHLRVFLGWLVHEEIIEHSPLEYISPPVVRSDQIQPFSRDQIASLLQTARRSRHPKRDEALIWFLLDTGLRASEVCCLKIRDMDLAGRRCTALGKGNKRRAVFFGLTTAKSLSAYLCEDRRNPDDPVFRSDRGDQPLSRSGLFQLIQRLGQAANLQAVRCSPHTFRHTFAIEFLRAGGNVFSLKEMLGHTSLTITNRYLAIAQADIENQHRLYSPADNFMGKQRDGLSRLCLC